MAGAITSLLTEAAEHLSVPPAVLIASAYFNPGGYGAIAEALDAVGPVKLLLGAEPEVETGVKPLGANTPLRRKVPANVQRALEGHERSMAADRDLLGFTRSDDELSRRLVEWLRSSLPDGRGRVQVRRFKKGFLHGKAFVVDAPYGKGVIAGSSNFTRAGLSWNRELNLGQYQPEAVDAVRSWFTDLWDESEDFDLAALYEARWAPHLPMIVFWRMLWELYGADLEAEQQSRERTALGLTGFQADGVWRAKRILDRLHGVVVADEVGLGKTFIAGELIHEATIVHRQKVLIVAPATLRDSTWNPFLNEKNLKATVVSYEELTNEIDTAGQSGSKLMDIDEYALIIVDEAHALRNASTKRADTMRLLTEGESPKDLVLLTATPVNNSLLDLYNLLSYFVTNDAAFADVGVPSLRDYFNRAMAMNPDDLSPEHLFDVLDQVAVRRTRKFVRNHYPNDTVVIKGEKRQISFPTPKVRRVDYDLEQSLPGMFQRLAEALGVDDLDDQGGINTTTAHDKRGQILTLARYTPSRFRLSDLGETEQYERQNAGLLRSALLKRFESSSYAFQRTLEAMIRSHEQFLSALAAGAVLTGDALREWASSDSDNLDDFLDSYDGDTDAHVSNAADYDLEALQDEVEADLELLRSFHTDMVEHHANDDPKINALVDELVAIVEQAERDGVTNEQKRNARKVLLFSYFADTVEHIQSRLLARIHDDPRLACYQDRVAVASGPDRRGRAEIIAGFAPLTAGSDNDEDRYDLLIATDVLAEGVNLQQARNIINYDLPWNPMRLVQRHGRIDRIGSLHSEVYLRCFFPDTHLEALLGLEERLQNKLKQAAAAVGVGDVLPGFAGREVNITETRDQIERLKAEDAALFESGGSAALSGEDFRRRLERALRDIPTRSAVMELPWGSGTGFTRPGAEPGFVFCARIGDQPQPWFRYVPLAADLSVQTRPATPDDGEVPVPIVVDDTLACLAHADPGDPATERVLSDEMYEAAFDAWAVAREHIVAAWNHLADPANSRPQIPRSLRTAAQLVRDHGLHLGNWQNELIDRLEAPHAPRIQRLVHGILGLADKTPTQKVDELSSLARRNNLTPYNAPEPKPFIVADDVHLVCWSAITPFETESGSLAADLS
ncbi:SNF2-related protein [Rhodococcus sp. As11]|uniref:SNF2-related protein n=1 Tax=Rhodococcus sp. As11 TaxID=3029189 RepID=UPI003B7651A0